jgi:hypothetical protein
MASRSAFAQWRAEKRSWLMINIANRLFRRGEGGVDGLLRRRMAPARTDAPLDPELEHPELEHSDLEPSNAMHAGETHSEIKVSGSSLSKP